MTFSPSDNSQWFCMHTAGAITQRERKSDQRKLWFAPGDDQNQGGTQWSDAEILVVDKGVVVI